MYSTVLSKHCGVPYDAKNALLNAMPVDPPKPRTRLPKRQALKLLQAGLTQTETAKRLSVSRCTVNRFVQTLNGELEHVERYRTLRPAALTSLQVDAHRLMKEILDDETFLTGTTGTQKAKILDTLIRVYGISYDKERLETGKRTKNIGLAGLVTYVHEHGLFTKEELMAGRSLPSGTAQRHQSGTPAPQCYSELPHIVTDDS